MPVVELDAVGPIAGAPIEALAGITDILIYETGNGPVLLTVTRGGGWLINYDLGSTPGTAFVAQTWQIDSTLTQLESTDLAILDIGAPVLLMAGLNTSNVIAMELETGDPNNALGGSLSFQVSGASAQSLSDLAVFSGTDSGIVAVRGGGVMSFDMSGGSMIIFPLAHGQDLQNAAVSDLVTASIGGRNLGMACFWGENAVSLFELGQDGIVRNIGNFVAAPDSAWFSVPTAATFVEVDGHTYAIVAAAGSNSLTVLEIDQNGAMQLADHVLDTLETRFADVSVFDVIEVNGMDIVVAAGSDDGLSAFILLPGGRLHLLATLEGSTGLPLAGITGIALCADGNAVRIFVSSESAPFLAELELTLPDPGAMLSLDDGGGTLLGTSGSDVLTGGAGSDRIEGGAGDDILLDGAGADTLVGGAGADEFLLTADGVTDVIEGFEPGTDRIDLTGLGVQWDFSEVIMITRKWGLELHFGDEVIELRTEGLTAASLSIEDFVTFGHVTYTGDGLNVPPSLRTGSMGNDQMFGEDDSERISGLGGHDRIEANGGDDTVWGDSGEDVLIGGDGNDSVSGGTQNDLIRGNDGADTMFGDGGDDRIFGGENDDQIDGGIGHDALEGGAGNDRIFAGAGNDIAHGDAGSDLILGGLGSDTLLGGLGADTLSGGDGRDRLVGDAGNDELMGGADNDTMLGTQGDDTLNGDAGDDVLRGGNDHDLAAGGAGNDVVIGGTGRDTLFGDADNDTVRGNGGFDTVDGGAGHDLVFGGAQADVVLGGEGNDTVFGGGGFDRIDGGTGDDVLTGNFNADRFIFSDGHGQDTITDFDATNNAEKIDLSAVSGLGSIDDVLAVSIQVGADVLIDTGGGNAILLQAVSLADLDANDFVF